MSMYNVFNRNFTDKLILNKNHGADVHLIAPPGGSLITNVNVPVLQVGF